MTREKLIINPDSIVVAAKNQRYSKLDQEVVIISLSSEEYYGLNPIGATIWHLIQQPKTFTQIQEEIFSQYEVSPEQLNQDILSFLEQLQAEGLIDIQ